MRVREREMSEKKTAKWLHQIKKVCQRLSNGTSSLLFSYSIAAAITL